MNKELINRKERKKGNFLRKINFKNRSLQSKPPYQQNLF